MYAGFFFSLSRDIAMLCIGNQKIELEGVLRGHLVLLHQERTAAIHAFLIDIGL